MKFIVRFFLSFFVGGSTLFLSTALNLSETSQGAIVMLTMILWLSFGWPRGEKVERQPPNNEKPIKPLVANPNNAEYVLDGVSDTLEVFETKVVITSKKTAAAILIRGLKGSKSIPYSSITAVQFREANPMNGFIQFSIIGAIESGGGIIQGISDENTIFFIQPMNETAAKIRDFVESKIFAKSQPMQNLTDQIANLASLNKSGVLSDDEFSLAKAKLLGN